MVSVLSLVTGLVLLIRLSCRLVLVLFWIWLVSVSSGLLVGLVAVFGVCGWEVSGCGATCVFTW